MLTRARRCILPASPVKAMSRKQQLTLQKSLGETVQSLRGRYYQLQASVMTEQEAAKSFDKLGAINVQLLQAMSEKLPQANKASLSSEKEEYEYDWLVQDRIFERLAHVCHMFDVDIAPLKLRHEDVSETLHTYYDEQDYTVDQGEHDVVPDMSEKTTALSGEKKKAKGSKGAKGLSAAKEPGRSSPSIIVTEDEPKKAKKGTKKTKKPARPAKEEIVVDEEETEEIIVKKAKKQAIDPNARKGSGNAKKKASQDQADNISVSTDL
jgi:hypothetical protein